ncbi:thioesterase II family protein [Pseudoalteromonas sp. T1lg65]|uniref:thioesterase II family protein n=1 Tax=Pseudoalteromonas sp. T1lg65 TaxID=2077101 RepID=UPI003F7ABE83
MMGVDLYCFHHAGGSSLFFKQWASLLPADWQVHAIDLPGRGMKAGMQPLRDWDEVLSHLSSSTQISPRSERLCVFFGHSLGGMVAYKLADHFTNAGVKSADLICLSACRAPSITSKTQYSSLPHDELLDTLYELGLVPKHRLSEDVKQIIAGMFQSDFYLAEQPVTTNIKLTSPTELILADQDHLVDTDSYQAWSAFCDSDFTHHIVKGDHMYLQDQPEITTNLLVNAVERHFIKLQQTKIHNPNWQKPLC